MFGKMVWEGRKSTRTLYTYVRGNGPKDTLIPLLENAYDEVDRLQGVIAELGVELAAIRAAQLANFHATQASDLSSAQDEIRDLNLLITELFSDNERLDAENKEFEKGIRDLRSRNQMLQRMTLYLIP